MNKIRNVNWTQLELDFESSLNALPQTHYLYDYDMQYTITPADLALDHVYSLVEDAIHNDTGEISPHARMMMNRILDVCVEHFYGA